MKAKDLMNKVARAAFEEWINRHPSPPNAETAKYADQAKKLQSDLENFIEELLKPGFREWLSTRLGRGKFELFVRAYINRKDRIDRLIMDFEDAHSGLSCCQEETAFLEGFKAGARFRNEADKWAEEVSA